MKRTLILLTAAAVFFLMAPAAGAQQQSGTAPAKQAKAPAKKAKKVWGEEDLGSLRKASDEYAESKARAEEAAAAGEAAAKSGEAKPGTMGAEGEAAVKAENDKSLTEHDEGSPTDRSRGDMFAGIEVDTLEQVEEQVDLKGKELVGMEELLYQARRKFEATGNPAEREDLQKEIDGAAGHVERIKAEIAWLEARALEISERLKAAAAGQAGAPAAPPAAAPPAKPPVPPPPTR
jgi:hypothetical protein